MTGNEQQRTAIVTGGSSGIGFAIASRLVQDGYRVAIVGRDAARLEAAVARLGGAAIGQAGDLSVRHDAEAVVAAIAARWSRIDVLVNNAGLTGRVGADTKAGEAEAVWDAVLHANLKSLFLTTMAVLPHLADRAARIVNIGSIAARAGSLLPGGLAYAAAKAGVARLTEALAAELLDRGVTVNALLPSIIDTPPNRKDMPDADFSRWVRPEQLAATIGFLLSDDAQAITGASIPVSGRVA